MATRSAMITSGVFKNSGDFDRYSCLSCNNLLNNPVQLACGHRLCRTCADKLIAATREVEITPRCPDTDCNEEISEEDGAYYFPDRFAQREILNLVVTCPFREVGCNWEGRFKEYQQHIENCDFALSTCKYCEEKMHKNQLEAHSQSCPKAPKKCPLSALGCMMSAASNDKLQQHMEESAAEHFEMLAKRTQLLEKRFELTEVYHSELEQKDVVSSWQDFVEADGAITSGQRYDSSIDNRNMSPQPHGKTQLFSHLQSGEVASSLPLGFEKHMHTIIESVVTGKTTKMQEEITELKMMVNKLERTIQSKNAELFETYKGSMIWKTPQFSQRKADADNGRYTSIFSLPFYSGRYGYKMCLCPYMAAEMDEEIVGLKTVTQKFGTESPFKILLPLATLWKTIGALLGLKKDNLTKIQSEEQNVYDRLLEMLSQWSKHQIDPPPSWEALADAVEKVDPSIAKHIREKHPDKHELLPQL